MARAAASPPPALGPDHSGLLLELAASSVDAEHMQKQVEGLQTYCQKLERAVSEAGAAPKGASSGRGPRLPHRVPDAWLLQRGMVNAHERASATRLAGTVSLLPLQQRGCAGAHAPSMRRGHPARAAPPADPANTHTHTPYTPPTPHPSLRPPHPHPTPQVEDLREEKHLLRRALQSVQGDPAAVAHCQAVLAGTPGGKGTRRSSRQRADARGGAARPAVALHADASGPRYTESCEDEADDASSISLMSLNEDDASVTTAAATPTTAASLAVSQPSPAGGTPAGGTRRQPRMARVVPGLGPQRGRAAFLHGCGCGVGSCGLPNDCASAGGA